MVKIVIIFFLLTSPVLGKCKYYSEAEVIAGVATAGIPQGSLISNELNKPFVYIRSKPKSHGMENLIEGRLEKIGNIKNNPLIGAFN